MNDDTNNLEGADEALHQFLKRELDPHVGSATAKLDALLASTARHSVQPSSLRIGLRWSAAAILLLGLSIAAPIIASRWHSAPIIAAPVAIRDNSRPPADAIVTSWSETVDGGTVFVDPETPARMLKRTRYEKAEWKDAAGQWQSLVTKPDEDVILVDLQKQ